MNHDRARTALGTVVLLACVLTGSVACTANSSSSTPTRPSAPAITQGGRSSSSATTPVASPTEWSTEEAQRQYVAAVAPGNQAIDAYNKLSTSKSEDVDAWHSACTAVADADDQLQRTLAAGSWPTKSQSAITSFIGALSGERSVYQQCSTAISMDAVYAALAGLQTASASDEAQTVRITLGLPGTG